MMNDLQLNQKPECDAFQSTELSEKFKTIQDLLQNILYLIKEKKEELAKYLVEKLTKEEQIRIKEEFQGVSLYYDVEELPEKEVIEYLFLDKISKS